MLEKAYPVAGSDFLLRPVALIVDSAGEAGVTEKAYAFYRQQKGLGNVSRIFLNKGQGGLERDRARYGEPEKILQKKSGRRSDIRLVYSGTDKLKDEIRLSLTRREPGPGAIICRVLSTTVCSPSSAPRSALKRDGNGARRACPTKRLTLRSTARRWPSS